MASVFRKATVVKTLDPRKDKDLPEEFRNQDWARRLNVDANLLSRLPHYTQKCVETSETTSDAVFKRIIGEGEISLGAKRIGFIHTWKQAEVNAWVWRLLAFGAVWYFWLAAAAFLPLPDISLGIIGERIFNLRSIPSKLFTFIQLIPMFYFKYLDFGMCLQFVRERLVGPASTSIGFAPLAFSPSLRYLYDSALFITSIGAGGIVAQIIIQFSERLWHRFWVLQWISKERLSDAQFITDAIAEITRLRGQLGALTAWLSQQSISDAMTMRMSVTKDEINRKIDYLLHAVPKNRRPAAPPHAPGPKFPYIFANGLVLFGNSLFYLRAWGSFLQAFGYAVVMEITTVLKVYEPHQSLNDIQDFTTKTVSNLVGQVMFVSMIYRIAIQFGFDIAENTISFTILLVAQIFYVLVLTSWAIPLLIRFGKWLPGATVRFGKWLAGLPARFGNWVVRIIVRCFT